MVREREFIQKRFAIVEERLDDPRPNLDRVERYQLQRERRLLGKILYEVPEGKVLKTLQSWRERFNTAWTAHRQRAWQGMETWQSEKSEGERWSAGAVITDKSGYKWVIDGRYMEMVDDLIHRLQLWLGEESR